MLNPNSVTYSRKLTISVSKAVVEPYKAILLSENWKFRTTANVPLGLSCDIVLEWCVQVQGSGYSVEKFCRQCMLHTLELAL